MSFPDHVLLYILDRNIVQIMTGLPYKGGSPKFVEFGGRQITCGLSGTGKLQLTRNMYSLQNVTLTHGIQRVLMCLQC